MNNPSQAAEATGFSFPAILLFSRRIRGNNVTQQRRAAGRIISISGPTSKLQKITVAHFGGSVLFGLFAYYVYLVVPEPRCNSQRLLTTLVKMVEVSGNYKNGPRVDDTMRLNHVHDQTKPMIK